MDTPYTESLQGQKAPGSHNLTAKGGFEIQLWAQLLCRNGREQLSLVSACCHTKSQRGRERFVPYKNSEFLRWKVILAMKHHLQCQWFSPPLSTISSLPLVHEHKVSEGGVLQPASPSSRCWEVLPFPLCTKREAWVTSSWLRQESNWLPGEEGQESSPSHTRINRKKSLPLQNEAMPFKD